MAVLTFAQLQELIEDELVVNTATDAPLDAAELLRAINDAYGAVYEISGGVVKIVPSSLAWSEPQLSTGLAFGLLTDIREVLDVYASSDAPQSIVCDATISSPTLTSAALFGNLRNGMHIFGTDIPANTHIKSIASTSSLTMTRDATAGTEVARIFSESAGVLSGLRPMNRVDRDKIQFLKRTYAPGTYATPQCYSLIRQDPVDPSAASVTTTNLLLLEYWPPSTGFYFPMTYWPQYTPMDAGASDVPVVNDIESYDIAYLAAAYLAPRYGRHELVPGILMKVSDRTAAALERKLKALLDAGQAT